MKRAAQPLGRFRCRPPLGRHLHETPGASEHVTSSSRCLMAYPFRPLHSSSNSFRDFFPMTFRDGLNPRLLEKCRFAAWHKTGSTHDWVVSTIQGEKKLCRQRSIVCRRVIPEIYKRITRTHTRRSSSSVAIGSTSQGPPAGIYTMTTLTVLSLALTLFPSSTSAQKNLFHRQQSLNATSNACRTVPDQNTYTTSEILSQCGNATLFNVWRPKARFIAPEGWMNGECSAGGVVWLDRTPAELGSSSVMGEQIL